MKSEHDGATALAHWMLDTGRTDRALANEINALVKGDKRVSARQVGRWRRGEQQPRPWVLKELAGLSAGLVDANSFVEAMT